MSRLALDAGETARCLNDIKDIVYEVEEEGCGEEDEQRGPLIILEARVHGVDGAVREFFHERVKLERRVECLHREVSKEPEEGQEAKKATGPVPEASPANEIQILQDLQDAPHVILESRTSEITSEDTQGASPNSGCMTHVHADECHNTPRVAVDGPPCSADSRPTAASTTRSRCRWALCGFDLAQGHVGEGRRGRRSTDEVMEQRVIAQATNEAQNHVVMQHAATAERDQTSFAQSGRPNERD